MLQSLTNGPGSKQTGLAVFLVGRILAYLCTLWLTCTEEPLSKPLVDQGPARSTNGLFLVSILSLPDYIHVTITLHVSLQRKHTNGYVLKNTELKPPLTCLWEEKLTEFIEGQSVHCDSKPCVEMDSVHFYTSSSFGCYSALAKAHYFNTVMFSIISSSSQ